MAAKKDVYQIITDRMIERLNEGIIPWKKPWQANGADHPRNMQSKRPYHGINVMMTMAQGYGSPYWGTFNQIKNMGGSVKAGEHGTPIVFWKFLEKEERREDGTVRKVSIPMLRYFTVFNAEQCEGLDLPEPEAPTGETVSPSDLVAEYLENNGPSLLHHDQDRAFYSPSTDTVSLPLSEQFQSPAHYHATLFHELGHSTGHETRLDRKIRNGFGNTDYAREELVAEMTAAFLCSEVGIAPIVEDNTVAYIQSWIRNLQNDPRAVVVAAGAASKAAELIKNGGQASSKEEAA